MIDRTVVTRRIEEIDRHLKRIEEYADIGLEKFQQDPIAQDVVEYNFFQIVNHLIDIAQHIVVDEEYGFPQTAYEAGQILFEKHIFTQNDLAIYREMVGFRNVVGHDYTNINKKIVYSILKNGPKDIKGLVSRIVKKFL
jgi:uncharacterized protein YutE (UPF0331/DUF86 family)